jgi:pyruvate dehydrogenase E1 component alpha subunit
MKTYRYRGHSMSDPAKYRSKEEVAEYKEHRDPIEGLKNHMVKNGVANEENLKEIDKKIRDRVQQAVDFAENSPEPDESELWTDIYN